MATFIQINNINYGDLQGGDDVLMGFSVEDARFVQITDGDVSKVYEAEFETIYTREELMEILEDGDAVCVSKDTADDYEFFKKSDLIEEGGYWSSDVVFKKETED